MGKLVRDLIPRIIRADGRDPLTRVLSESEYERELHVKLGEESAELREASGEQVLEELADVYEVLCAMAAHRGYSIQNVARKAAEKRVERGGFDDRLWLESW